MSIQSNPEYNKIMNYISRVHKETINYTPNTVSTDFLMSKTFKHDSNYNIVFDSSFEKFISEITSNTIKRPSVISIDPSSQMKWVDPQTKYAISLSFPYPYTYPFTPYPEVGSRESFCDLFEVYFMSWLRDVPFYEYTNNSNYMQSYITKILTYLNQMMPNNNNFSHPLPATAANLFRGKTKGDLLGPYVSQFLIHKPRQNYHTAFTASLPQFKAAIPAESDVLEHYMYNNPIITSTNLDTSGGNLGRSDFGLIESEFINIQNGYIKGGVTIPTNYKPFTVSRCVLTGRDLATLVHADYPAELLIRAVEILLTNGAPLSKSNPYVSKILGNGFGGFVHFSGVEIHNLMGEIAKEALKVAWYFKYHNMRMRPEEFAGKIHYQKKNNTNIIPNLNQDFITNILNDHKTYNSIQNVSNSYLLSLIYPEGAPIHPSYPAGHAIIASACVSVIKALFDEDYLFRNLRSGTMKIYEPYNDNYIKTVGSTKRLCLSETKTNLREITEGVEFVTIGNELDKLVSNIATGRNFAGIHYRSDSEYSFDLGEEVAANYLRSKLREFGNKDVKLVFTNRNGEKVNISMDSITII
jgi:hypothetical protein